jgi:protein-tyrosine-phosphatase
VKYKKILFVCSGNQCRSPMAEAIFRDMVAKDSELRSVGIDVKSVGTLMGIDGKFAINEAITAMHEHGIDLSQHKAKHLNLELVTWADIILVMEPKHEFYIAKLFTSATKKVHLLTQFVGELGYVADPIGLGLDAYRQCADQLLVLLTLLKRQIQQKYIP